jgi:glycine/D-amino acid oxidase-like deaminating enzyme
MSESPDALIVGGGLIGLAIAWRASRRGLRVTVIDPQAATRELLAAIDAVPAR